MSDFGAADKASRGSSDKVWKILAVLAEIPKNKSDVLKITRVSYAGKELINLQVWRTDKETCKSYPIKEQRISFNIDLKDKVAEAISE